MTDHTTIIRYLKSMGKVQKFNVLNKINKDSRVAIRMALLTRHRLARQQQQPFLSHIITADQK